MKEIVIPLTSFIADSSFLLPRPYPGFQRLKYKTNDAPVFNLLDADKIEVMFLPAEKSITLLNIAVETIYLKK